MTVEIEEIFAKLAEDEWADFIESAKLLYKYNYSTFEKDLFMSGFTKGITSGWLIHKKLVEKEKEKVSNG